MLIVQMSKIESTGGHIKNKIMLVIEILEMAKIEIDRRPY